MADRMLTGARASSCRSCSAPPPHRSDEVEVVFSFQDPEIVESSGLALVDGLVVTTNDSGDTGRVFAVDPATGETVGTTGWGDEPEDVEALAPGGPGSVWVGDIGDNLETRDTVQVTQVPVGAATRDVDGRDLRPRLPRRRRTTPRRCWPTRRPGGCTSPPRRCSAARCTPRRPSFGRPTQPARAAGRRAAASPPTVRSSRTDGTWWSATTRSPRSTRSRPWSGSARSTCPSQQQGEGIAVDATGPAAAQLGGRPLRGAAGDPAGRGTLAAMAPPVDPRPRRPTLRRRPSTESRRGRGAARDHRDPAVGVAVAPHRLLGVAFIVVLVRSLRRRSR